MPVTKGVNIIDTVTTLNTNEILKNEFYIHSDIQMGNTWKAKPFIEAYNNFSKLLPLHQSSGIRSYLLRNDIVASELALELFRQEKYPTFPSRINGIFAFLSFNHAREFGKGYVYKAKINESITYAITIHNFQEISAHRIGNLDATPKKYWEGFMQDYYYKDNLLNYRYHPILKEVLVDGEFIIELIATPIR